MIKVTIMRSAQGLIESFTMNGHASFAEHGQDIVCAGASAVSFGSINAIVALTNVMPEVDQGGDGGFLSCLIPMDLPKDTEEKVQLLLEGMVVSLETIENDYGQYIKIINK